MAGAAMQGAPAHQEGANIHTHSYTDGTAIGSNLGLSILPKDTSTCGLEEPGIEPPILRLVDDRSTSEPQPPKSETIYVF